MNHINVSVPYRGNTFPNEDTDSAKVIREKAFPSPIGVIHFQTEDVER